MVHFAGASDSLVGVTHECDFPRGVEDLPKLTASKIDHHTMTSRELDEAVGRLSDASGLYALDAKLLERLAPDLVVTQGLCEVCAVSESVVEEAVGRLSNPPKVLSLNPTSLGGVLESAIRIGEALSRGEETRKKVEALRSRLDDVAEAVSGRPRPRVGCIEWLDPPFSAGHWVPEMVELAGGKALFAGPGESSRRMSWREVSGAAPEVLVLMPCGFDVDRALGEIHAIEKWTGSGLPAVRDGRVWVVDANSCFSRPAPRLVEGVETLARILHPDAFTEIPAPGDAVRLTSSPATASHIR